MARPRRCSVPGSVPPARHRHLRPHVLRFSVLAIAARLCLGCSASSTIRPPDDAPAVAVSATEGEDYSLPAWAQKTPFTGYVDHPDLGAPAGENGQRNLWVSWRDLEPTRGQYDWKRVDDALAAAGAGGFTISLQLQSIVRGGGAPERGIIVPNAVPDWVLTDFGLTDDDLVNLGWEFDLLVIPAWRPEIRDAFNDLILAFGARGYPQDPRLGSAYIHGISPSRGEEFWLEQTQINTLELNSDFSPQVLTEWIDSRFQSCAEAFSGATHKLAWVGILGSWRYCDPAYADVASRLCQNAWGLGIGTRHSSIEYYHSWINEPALGQAVDENGYLTVDETIPPIATVRYFGDENEEYGDAWVWRFGSRSGEAQRYRFAMLRALQMRLRFLWTSPAAEQINPALSNYARYGFGKNVHDSADAWAYLSETPAGTHWSLAGVVRNFERWLRQRDVPGGVTVPTERVSRQFNSGCLSNGQASLYYDDVARRTDIASGNGSICFDLDDRFVVTGTVAIKVETRDDDDAAWRIEYVSTHRERVLTPVFRNLGDGKVRTVTFTIPDAVFANGMDHGMDFRIVCDGPGNVTVRWVRVIRQQI